jgi:DNA polymerase-4
VTRARTILHLDMDAFFASVEVLDAPALRGRPVLVGGTGARGVVASASYEARAVGVHAAMPMSVARRRCPDAVVLSGRHDRYAEVSGEVMAVCLDVTPLVEPLSLDEAFLDVTGALRGRRPVDVGHALRARVRTELGLGCSVGVGPTKLVAKLATEAAKPRASPQGALDGLGVVVVEPGEVQQFLHAHPIAALWGVGPAMRARLERLGVRTVGDLAALPDATVRSMGDSGVALVRLAQGHDDRGVVPDRRAKSIGHEETFATDRFGVDELLPVARRQCDAVARRLRRAEVGARTVSVKVRYLDFRTVTRSRTLPSPTDRSAHLFEVVERLLAGLQLDRGVRLLGVSCGSLVEGAPRQLSLDEAGDPGGSVDRVVDDIRSRWGPRAIGPGSSHPGGRDRPVR